MSNSVTVVALVEGSTERIFIADMIAPHLATKNIYITPIVISKPGQKGGDVRFGRVKNDIELHLKQRRDTYLTLFIDYYGIKADWPGLDDSKRQNTPIDKALVINRATKDQVLSLFENCRADRRFIPYVAMHEFEAMLFSIPGILATHLQVHQADIDKICSSCATPEHINDSPQSAPSKRLEMLSNRFKKTSTGITIAKAIGLGAIRERCHIFNEWLSALENLCVA